MPRLDYAARVRSGPSGVSYQGQWSHWSSEVRWRSGVGGELLSRHQLLLDLDLLLRVLLHRSSSRRVGLQMGEDGAHLGARDAAPHTAVVLRSV